MIGVSSSPPPTNCFGQNTNPPSIANHRCRGVGDCRMQYQHLHFLEIKRLTMGVIASCGCFALQS
jgi:hypothetical protein